MLTDKTVTFIANKNTHKSADTEVFLSELSRNI